MRAHITTIDTKSYKEWLLRRVCDLPQMRKYSELWDKLYSTEYKWVIPQDKNRAADGVDLRYKYKGDGYICMNGPCTVLEMLVALAIRCENELMGDIMQEDKTKKWFWMMIKNLELDEMTDLRYDEYFVESVLDIWMANRYEFDGRGGLFWIKNIEYDMRNVEIWYQMIWFMNDFADKYAY